MKIAKNKIQVFRLKRGLSQNGLREKLKEKGVEINRDCISLWENQHRQPRDAYKPVIADVLKVPPQKLFVFE